MAKTVNNKYTIQPYIKAKMEIHFHEMKSFYENGKVIKSFNWSDYYEATADYCGVSPSTISQLKNKNLTPSLILALRLSKWLGVPVERLCRVVEKDKEVETAKCIYAGCDRQATAKGVCLKHLPHYYSQQEKESDNDAE